MKVRDATALAFEGTDEALSADDVIARMRALPRGERWTDTTLRTVLRAMAPNAAAGRHDPTERRHGFMFAPGGGRTRRWYVASDGGRSRRQALEVSAFATNVGAHLPLAAGAGSRLGGGAATHWAACRLSQRPVSPA